MMTESFLLASDQEETEKQGKPDTEDNPAPMPAGPTNKLVFQTKLLLGI